jgi:tetratricopeptide (TPR) repeat protein
MFRFSRSVWRSLTRPLYRLFDADFWRGLIPFWLTPEFYWLVLTYPFRWFFHASKDRRLRDLLWGLPAIALLITFAVVFHRLRQQTVSIANTYWLDTQAAMAVKDYRRAEMLLDRILQEDTTHLSDARYRLAILLSETGRAARAEVIFNALAPDGRRGNPEAHQRMALLLSEKISDQSSPEQLDRLRWHLQTAANQESPEMSLAWGRFSVAIRDLETARRYLEKAATKFPELWITIGEVNVRLGNADRAIGAFEKASQFLVSQLESVSAAGSESRGTRIDYATVLMRLGRLDEARVVLEEGLKSDPEGDWHQLLAALYVNYHDLLSIQGGHQIGELLGPVAKSLDHEPNFPPALNRLMAYATAKVEGNIELKKVLARVVAEGKQPALAHLALGNVCWMEGDTDGAVFHFERSLSINPKLAVVMNNLAWLVSHDEKKPDLERAMAMINSALQEEPENGSFLDTRGTIYMLMDKNKEALDDLEKSLQTVKDVAAVHAKLAALNEKLGRTEMAEQHKLLEQEIRAAAEKLKEGAVPKKP